VIKRARGAKIEEYGSNLKERPTANVREFIQCGEVVSVSTPRSAISPAGTRLIKKAVLTFVVARERGQV